MEQPTEQPSSVGQIEQPVRILEQPNQPIDKQRRSEVSRETRETSRDINNMAAPWSHQVFDRLSKNLDSYEKQGDLMNKISERVNQLSTQVAKPVKDPYRRNVRIQTPKNREFNYLLSLISTEMIFRCQTTTIFSNKIISQSP